MAGLPSTQGFLLPTRYIPYIANTNAAISLIPIFAGLLGIIQPQTCLSALEFPRPDATPPTTAAAQANSRLIEGLTKMYAVRQFAGGVGTMVAWYYGAYRVMGVTALAAGVLMAGVDAVVAREVAGKQVWGHWVGVGLAGFFGATLTGIL